MERILIIEDNTNANQTLADALRKKGHLCVQAFSGTEGLFYIDREPFSLVILETALKGLRFGEVTSRIRQYGKIPIFPISAAEGADKAIRLFAAEAEGLPMKSLKLQEFIAIISLQIRHTPLLEKDFRLRTFQYRELILDTSSCQAAIHGRTLPLTRQEFKILELVLGNPDHIFSKQDIYDYAWDDFYAGDNKTVNVHISNIRKKLKPYTDFNYIRTVWGTGFTAGKK